MRKGVFINREEIVPNGPRSDSLRIGRSDGDGEKSDLTMCNWLGLSDNNLLTVTKPF